MKGMYWVWIGALLMGMGIVGMMNAASHAEREPVPVFATQETEQPETGDGQ